ncbi:hypothetical protein KW786_03810, partial [Candidatus Parcubacteria bacterium]|nr:hypothetical protein [Candidatus Parcubacteria bacterium]
MQKIQYPKVKIQDVARAFWHGAQPKKWHLFAMIFCVIAGNITIVMVPLLYKQFFDVITQGGAPSAVGGQLITIIFYIALLNGAFWAFFRFAHIAHNGFLLS